MKRQLLEADHPLGVQELMRLLGLNPGLQTALKRTLRELVRNGQVYKDGKRFWVEGAKPRPSSKTAAPPRKGAKAAPARRESRSRAVTVEGVLHVHRDGFGFVHPSSGEGENIYLPAHEASRALDNDRVVVEVSHQGARSEGRLTQVTDRRRQFVVGTYLERGKNQALVQPRDSSLQGVIRVPRTQMARDGDMVKVRLGVGAELLGQGGGLFGEVAGSLGKPGDPSVEVLSVAYSQGFSDEFPAEVMDAADRVPPRVSPQETRGEGRRDVRNLPLLTIDGEDARDFDDAVYAERQGGGFRLVVAIADVSHYVREGTPLDMEALRRATSVYLPDRVLPMLPERLSNGICSLKPEEDRLCMVADLRMDSAGRLQRSELYPGVMRSVARCTYNEVQDVLDGKSVPHRQPFKHHFESLMELSRVLNRMRRERGAIDFDLPEYKVILDDEGRPARMEKRERKDAHRLVEECMLAANEAVARFFTESSLPSVYRYHGEPDSEKLAAFATMAKAQGLPLKPGGALSSKELNAFISKLDGHPEQRSLNQLLLRSMKQAIYSSTERGHYGLGAEHYLHFTSPIRRYPDLLVHRLLKAHWALKKQARSESQLEAEEARLEAMAEQSSDRERGAMAVEREVISFYAALLMKDRVGEEFAATVASVTDFGFFVELDEEHVEGLVKAEALGPGAKLDKVVNALSYPNGQRIRAGMKLTVRLISVNLQRRQIDFEPLALEGNAPLPRGRGAEPSEATPTRKRIREPVAAAPEKKFSGRPTPPKRSAPPARTAEPVRPVVWQRPAAPEPEREGSGSSPHPGFDRIRALARMQGKSSEPVARKAAPDGKSRRPSGPAAYKGKASKGPSAKGKSKHAGKSGKPTRRR